MSLWHVVLRPVTCGGLPPFSNMLSCGQKSDPNTEAEGRRTRKSMVVKYRLESSLIFQDTFLSHHLQTHSGLWFNFLPSSNLSSWPNHPLATKPSLCYFFLYVNLTSGVGTDVYQQTVTPVRPWNYWMKLRDVSFHKGRTRDWLLLFCPTRWHFLYTRACH